MATPVLPYPDMDFTPLDILTAAEMDQMVANDQYLRDFCAGLADGTNLSDGVIQARKLTPGIGNYSTSEVDTGFTWVDGKSIYKKTISIGALPNNTTKNVAHGITSIDKIINWTGASTNTLNNQVILLPAPANATFTVIVNNTNIVITTTSDRSGYSYSYITLYYTKI